MSNKFISVVPSIRTIPGVEIFDYAIPEDASVAIGDVIRVPFRKKELPALIVAMSDTSPVAAKAHLITHPDPLLCLGNDAAQLLAEASRRSFTSQPSVLLSWIRAIPKRAKTMSSDSDLAEKGGHAGPPLHDEHIPIRETRFLVDRWDDERGVIAEAKRSHGKILILTPWHHRADELASRLGASVLHANVADGAAWKAVSAFATNKPSVLVATRIGAWLSCIADLVLIDEPENDDFKSDELSPRLDSRWIVAKAAHLRPSLSVIAFSTTNRLGVADTKQAPTINVALTREPWKRRWGSQIDLLSPASVLHIDSALKAGGEAWIIHPITGDRASLTCRDCGWAAMCTFCSFRLSQNGRNILCKRCGRKGIAPDECGSCGGMDFSRGQPGAEHLAKQCASVFQTDRIRVIDPMEFDRLTHVNFPPEKQDACHAPLQIILTDISLLAPGVEDIRRKERLLIAWRRVCASAVRKNAKLHAQGHEEALNDCADWLTTTGVSSVWENELRERRTFGYPPAVRLAKLLIDGSMDTAEAIKKELDAALPGAWNIEGPYPVEFRSYTRVPRHIVHVKPPISTSESELVDALNPWKKRALIDLDPIAFFS
jgi:primosomal protein N'